MTEIVPNFTSALCCHNCKHYKKDPDIYDEGKCKKYITWPNAQFEREVHCTNVCDGHEIFYEKEDKKEDKKDIKKDLDLLIEVAKKLRSEMKFLENDLTVIEKAVSFSLMRLTHIDKTLLELINGLEGDQGCECIKK